MNIPEFLRQYATRSDVTWSIATFGAIAEFSFSDGEAVETTVDSDGISMVSPRGAFRFNIPPHVRIIAYEALSKHPDLWSQGIAVCLPEADAGLPSKSCITEIGVDREAINTGKRDALLFDIGIGAPHVRACLRTSDSSLISFLRKHEGTLLFGDDSTALREIIVKSPDRVFLSALGRIEVATPIAHEDGETALGPHTHVLPDLLAHNRTHAANVPIPDEHLSCLNLFPPNPARDERGNPRPFCAEENKAFQDIFSTYGNPEAVKIKRQVSRYLDDVEGPEAITADLNRVERTALRVALRQRVHTHGDSTVLQAWRLAHEPNDCTGSQSG